MVFPISVAILGFSSIDAFGGGFCISGCESRATLAIPFPMIYAPLLKKLDDT